MTMRTWSDSALAGAPRAAHRTNSNAANRVRPKYIFVSLPSMALPTIRPDHLTRDHARDRVVVKPRFRQDLTRVLAQPGREATGRRLGFRPCAGLAHGADAAFRRMLLPAEETGIGEVRVFQQGLQR